MKETKFALRHEKSGKLLGFYIEQNRGDFCVDTAHTLCHSEENTWYAQSAEHAEWVRQHPTEWYNAGYDTPRHDYTAEELTVVKLDVETVMTRINVTLPTFEEFAKWASRGNERDYEFYMWQKKENADINFDFYQLSQMLRETRGVNS